MRCYDYSFLANSNVPAKLLNLLTGVWTMRADNESRKDLFKTVFTELQRVAIVQSVKESNAIEGILTTDERLNAIVNQNSAPLNHNEFEIAAYRDVLSLVHRDYSFLDFDEATILGFHKTLFENVDPERAGHYKTRDNAIVEIAADGTERMRFEPIPANETAEAMRQLFLAYRVAANDANINQLLLIPCVILDFLCVHPFSDGNGRMSRLLTLLLLYKVGFDAGKYISFEEQISKNKQMYYESLRRASINWHQNENDYFEFVNNFLFTLFNCYKELDKRFATLNSRKINKSSRIEATVLNSLLPISKAEICKILPDVSPTTVESVLSKLVKNEAVIKLGAGKNTRYIKNRSN